MSIVSRKFNKKETGTVFRHAVSGKLLCRLDARLTRDDWMPVHDLLSLVYNAGTSHPSLISLIMKSLPTVLRNGQPCRWLMTC